MVASDVEPVALKKVFVPTVEETAQDFFQIFADLEGKRTQRLPARWSQLTRSEQQVYVDTIRQMLEMGMICRPIHG